ncbi:MAG: efflux RND transporter permease subunit, partial [Thermomicrobiales bacterium]|nr:efflux RND transporter permease subunit [Thermomicrobiales bacterium]
AISIPVSLLVAVAVLDRMDYSLNIMTLAGLTIAIGRVIDDTIVVLENVYRHMSDGQTPFEAIRDGAREVTIAILGATAVTCAVFLPLGLTGGIIGALFLPFALAVVAALLASLVVAVTLVPTLSRFLLAGKVRLHEEGDPHAWLPGRIYNRTLNWALDHRFATLGIAALLLIGSLALVPRLPVAFLPDSGENIVTISVDARPGETAQAVSDRALEIEELLGNYQVETYQTVITGASADLNAIGNVISGTSPNSATITVDLASGINKQDAADQLRADIASNIPDSSGITVSTSSGMTGSSGVSITVSAANDESATELAAFTEQVVQTVAGVPDVVNVGSNLSATQPTVQVIVDPEQASLAGVSPQQISAELASLSSVQTLTVVNLDGTDFPVRLLVSSPDTTSIEELSAFEIIPGVRLDQVATLEEAEVPASITRIDGREGALVSGDITSEDVGGVSVDVQTAVDKLEVPAGLEVIFGGAASDINEGFTDLIVAILIAIVLVYSIMALLFRSWLDPMVILASLPMAAIGAIVALFVTNSTLSLSAMIGILMLVGIVVTNAIVLIEFVIMLREERGYDLRTALVEGGLTRLRPILMTAVATILALIPLSLGLTEGLLIASDLGRVVIGGLVSSTLLTLLVVPVFYSLADGLKRRWIRRRQPETPPTPEPAAPTA